MVILGDSSKPRRTRVPHPAGENDEDEAAIRIQSMFRGKKERKEFERRRGSGRKSVSSKGGLGTGSAAAGAMPVLNAWGSSVGLPGGAKRKPTRQLGSMWSSQGQLDEKEPLPERFLARLYLVLEDPGGMPPISNMVHTILMLTIILSIVCFMLETMPELLNVVSVQTWLIIEIYCTVVFTVEYGIRFLVCHEAPNGGKGRLAFLLDKMNLTDLLAILPFYLGIAMAGSGSSVKMLRVLRMVRLSRLFRIFKLGRYSQGMQMMWEALQASFQALWVLGFFLLIAVILCSSVLFYAESASCPNREAFSTEELGRYIQECEQDTYETSKGELCCDEHHSAKKFPSIVAGFWWSIVTMTTVGFGDVVPWTTVGRVVGVLSMLWGILLITLPVAVVGRKFQEVYERESGGKEDVDLSEESYKVRLKAFKDGMMVAAKDQKREQQGLELKRLAELSKPKLTRRIAEVSLLFDDAEELHHRLERMKELDLFRQEEIQFQFQQLMDDIGYTLSHDS